MGPSICFVVRLGLALAFGACAASQAVAGEVDIGVNQALIGPVVQVNRGIDRNAAPVAGLPATQGFGLTADGAVALLSRPCDGESCGAKPADGDIIVQFAPAEINTASIGYQWAGQGFVVLFTCTTIAPCIA